MKAATESVTATISGTNVEFESIKFLRLDQVEDDLGNVDERPVTDLHELPGRRGTGGRVLRVHVELPLSL